MVQYASISLEHCADLVAEAQVRGFDPDLVWTQEDVFSEYDIMWERRRLVGDCAATLVLSGSTDVPYDEGYTANLVEKTFRRPRLWGLAAVPALIVRYWAVCRVRAGSDLDQRFGAQLRSVLAASLEQIDGTLPLASPYYNFTDCWAHTKKIRFFANDGIFSDSFRHRIWFGRAMLFMFAKRNCKQTCKELWSPFSQVVHEEPDLPSTAFFDCLHCREGQMRTYTYHRKEWNDLVNEAVDDSEGKFLESFTSLSWILAAYVSIVPYRAWTGVMMWLDTKLNSTWYSRTNVPKP